MARQKGVFTLSGRIGNIVFYESPHGKLARTVGSLDKKRISRDPAFTATRETGAEFSRISGAGKLLRQAVRPFAPNAKDFSTHYRLNKLLVAILQEEPVHARGQRLLSHCKLQSLMGFEWHLTVPFHRSFLAGYTVSADRPTGILQVAVSEFQTASGIKAPSGATHCQLIAIGLVPDFDRQQINTSVEASTTWKLEQLAPALVLTCRLPAATSFPIVLCLGIRFYAAVSGQLNPLQGSDSLVVAGVW